MGKIKINGKELSLLEAKLYLAGLKARVIQPHLTEESRKNYEHWNTIFKEDKDKSSQKTRENGLDFSYKNERDYLIRTLSKNIGMFEIVKKVEYCEKHGHKESSSYITASSNSGVRAHGTCSRCRMMYTRGLTSKEAEDFDKMMNTSMTI